MIVGPGVGEVRFCEGTAFCAVGGMIRVRRKIPAGGVESLSALSQNPKSLGLFLSPVALWVSQMNLTGFANEMFLTSCRR